MQIVKSYSVYLWQVFFVLMVCTLSACSATTHPMFMPQVSSTPRQPYPILPAYTSTPTVVATSASILALSSTSTLTVTPTPILEPAPTSTPLSAFASLPFGQYIVYTTPGKDGLYVMSTDGRYQRKLTGLNGSAISSDGRQIVIYDDDLGPQLLDLEQNTLTNLPQGVCTYLSASPDATSVVMWCRDDAEIYVMSLKDGTRVRLTASTKREEYFFAPLWSPDGRWIAYFDITYGADTVPGEMDPGDGLYLVETSCLSEPDTCRAKARGPFQGNLWLQGPYSWSPDSQYLAILSRHFTGPIIIFSVKKGTFHSLSTTAGYSIEGLAWSPNGKWIAFNSRATEESQLAGIFLAPVDGTTPVILLDDSRDSEVMFWLTVPFQIGDVLVITDEGANLNLRKVPSLAGDVLMQLQSGEIVTVLEGPVKADGFTWWFMRVKSNGTEGWAVEDYGWYAPVKP